ncbi:MAG: hypothetical protein J6M23_08415, partial [Bacteroidales bacterium]|nr:hypothetical protein [Bacteroidales bacterium]
PSSGCRAPRMRGPRDSLVPACQALGRNVEFLDIHTEDREVGHVHNVTDPDLPESGEVNSRMIAS